MSYSKNWMFVIKYLLISFLKLSNFEIDVLVNNAGIGGSGSVENAEMEFAKLLMETNYFGAQMMKKVIPTMRIKRSGAIINVSSQAEGALLP